MYMYAYTYTKNNNNLIKIGINLYQRHIVATIINIHIIKQECLCRL